LRRNKKCYLGSRGRGMGIIWKRLKVRSIILQNVVFKTTIP